MKIFNFISIVFLVFVTLLTLTGFAFGYDKVREVEDIRQSDIFTDEQLKKILENTCSMEPEYLEKFKHDENTVFISGEIPFKEKEEAYDRWVSIQKVARLIQADYSFRKYLEINGGPLSGFGSSVYGYIIIYINPQKELTEYEIFEIKSIIEKYSKSENIEDLPIVFYNSDLDFNVDSFYDHVNPIRGGYQVSADIGNGFYNSGTIGFSAVRKNNSVLRGFVTAAHLLPYNTSTAIYQPTAAYPSIGNVIDNQSRIDAIFIPFSNADPIVNVGNDPVLTNFYPNRSIDNKTLMIVHGTSSVSSGSELRKYGGPSGNSGGFHSEYIYDKYFNESDKTIDTLGVMQITQGSTGLGGDSGGPVYIGMNLSISGVEDYQAFIVGTICGHNNNFKGNPVTFYAPVSEIDYYLGVKPITRQNLTLT